MNTQQFSRVFPLGSHLCREPMPPMSEMKRDMEILKRHGFNLIKLQEHWAIDESSEGRCDFSRYEELIAHAAQLDLGVYLGLTCEQAPNWLWDKHSGCRMIGRNGAPIACQAQTTLATDGKPGPCFDHPGARADMLRFIHRLVETLGRYENVVVWNTWQEIAYWAEFFTGQPVCYCPYTLDHFRRWLKEWYVDLDALNRAWNTRYSEWNCVRPEQGKEKYPCAQEIAWRYFMDNVQMADILCVRAATIRAADPLKRPVFAHKSAPIIGSGQDWTYARCQDFLGSSSYPAWFAAPQAWDDDNQRPFARQTALVNEMWGPLALRFDYLRCANPSGTPLWAAEFQGGPVSTGFHKGRVPSAEDIRRWMLTAVGSGITAFSFWVTRAEIGAVEANGFSLLDSVGDNTARLEEAGRVGRALQRHANLFGRPTCPRAEIAILINEWNYQFCGTMQQGGNHLGYDIRGWHRLLWEAGIAVDFLDVRELDEPHAADYKAIVMPFPLAVSEAVAAQLARYVEAGGHLISEAAPGRINEYAFCNRGELSPTLATLFGVRHAGFTMVREPDDGQRWSPPERTWGEYLEPAMLAGNGPLAGHRLRANVYIETYQPNDAEVILHYGEKVAGVMRPAGKGRAWLIGTFAGHVGTAYRDAESATCICRLLDLCGVRSDAAGRLLRRRRVTDKGTAWILTNPHAEPVTETLDIDGYGQVADLMDEELHRTGDRVTLTVAGLDVRVLLLSSSPPDLIDAH